MKATFGAGCFWHVEYKFSKIKGVTKTEVGFSGGNFENPTYEDVCHKDTKHAEVVMLEFDPKIVKYETLLEEFFKMHDPTQKDRQGPDFGAQYRSIIFYRNVKQKEVAEKFVKDLQKDYKKRIVTEIAPFKKFYRAEEYHQKYLEKKGKTFCGI